MNPFAWKERLGWEPESCVRNGFLDQGCDLELLRKVSLELNAEFPADYSEFILRSNGGIPPKNRLEIDGFQGVQFRVVRLLGIGTGNGFNPDSTLKCRDWLPPTAFLIGSLDSELERCPRYLVMESKGDPTIYAIDLVALDLTTFTGIWKPTCRGIYEIAESFMEFLERLY